MKKLIFLFGLLFSVSFYAQNADQQSILKDAKSFVHLTKDKNYDAVLDLTYPLIFEKFKREDLAKVFKQMMDGADDFKIEFLLEEKDPFEVSEISKDNQGTEYAFVTYPSRFQMKFLKEAFDKEGQNLMISVMELQGMKAQFVDDKTVLIQKQGMMVALKDKITKGTWKYLNFDEDNKLGEMLLSKEILSKAKDYYSKITEKKEENAN